jgi:hypothetical protein
MLLDGLLDGMDQVHCSSKPPRVGCSHSNLNKQDKATFRASLELSSDDPAIILFSLLAPNSK